MFFLAQLCGVLAWLCLILSYYRKNTNKILFIQIISVIFYLLNYLFLGAWTGLIVVVFELIRDSLFYKTDKDDLLFLLTIPFYLILGYLSRNNIIELIPIIASLSEGYTLTKSKKVIVPGAIIIYLLWVFYDIEVKAYSGALTDGLIVISNIYVLYNMITSYKKVNEFKIITKYPINNKTLDILNKLDKENYESNLLWDNDYQKNIYEKYKGSLIYVKYNNNIIGYINVLPISKDEYQKIVNSDYVINKYNLADKKSKYFIIDSMVLKEKYQNELSIKLFKNTLQNFIKKLDYKSIVSISVNDFENEILKNTNFEKIKKIDKDNILYIRTK